LANAVAKLFRQEARRDVVSSVQTGGVMQFYACGFTFLFNAVPQKYCGVSSHPPPSAHASLGAMRMRPSPAREIPTGNIVAVAMAETKRSRRVILHLSKEGAAEYSRNQHCLAKKKSSAVHHNRQAAASLSMKAAPLGAVSTRMRIAARRKRARRHRGRRARERDEGERLVSALRYSDADA
jgi:hypothetical protein